MSKISASLPTTGDCRLASPLEGGFAACMNAQRKSCTSHPDYQTASMQANKGRKQTVMGLGMVALGGGQFLISAGAPILGGIAAGTVLGGAVVAWDGYQETRKYEELKEALCPSDGSPTGIPPEPQRIYSY